MAKPDRPIAYFEMTPKKPTAQTTVTFDAGFSRNDGRQGERADVLLGLRRRQPARRRRPTRLIQHTFPTQAAWRDVKLLVGDGDDHVGLVPAARADRLLPDLLPRARSADRAAPALERPAADPCGTLAPDEQSAMIAAAATAGTSAAPTATTSDLASWALKPH